MHEDDRTNLFEIMKDRTEINSTIITSQLPVSKWYNYLHNNTVADTTLDRIVHSSIKKQSDKKSIRVLYTKIM